jgi:hypothetical protein
VFIISYGTGGDNITSNIGETKDYRSVQELSLKLIAAGLNKMSMADIKLWNCSSGADSGPNISYAKKFANDMRSRGYNLCKFYGYTQSISSFYEEGHKRAIGHRSGVLNWLLGRGGRYSMGRASDYRVEV